VNSAAIAQTVAADIAALDAAAALAEEALAYHREALILLAEGWQSETGSAIADFMNMQCGHAADVVDALRQAAGVLPDPRVDPSGDQVPGSPVNHAEAIPPFPDAAPVSDAAPAGPTGPIMPAVPASVPGPVPGPVPPWTSATSAPWSPAPAAEAPWAATGGPQAPAQPALPDLGGVLVGLVAEIAQALGSYAGTASATSPEDLSSLAADTRPDAPATSEPVSARTAVPDRTDGPATEGGTPGSGLATPVSLPPADPTVTSGPDGASGPDGTAAQPAPPPELLAAERPPAPQAAAPAPAPAPAPAQIIEPPAAAPAEAGADSPPSAAGADSPPSAAGADSPPSAAGADPEKAPCEIAADELPKVGE